jgi:hypothetical protein
MSRGSVVPPFSGSNTASLGPLYPNVFGNFTLNIWVPGPEDGDNMLVRIVGKYLPVDTA